MQNPFDELVQPQAPQAPGMPVKPVNPFDQFAQEQEDPQALPPPRVTPEDMVKRKVQLGGSRLNRWAGSFVNTIREGARAIRPIGISGVTRQDKGLTGALATFIGESEQMVNVSSSDGRKLTYAEGTPEWRLQQMFLQAQARGEGVEGFASSAPVKAFMKEHKLKPLRTGVSLGPVELFPGMADSVAPFAEGVGKGINKLLGTQLFGNTENWNAMASDLANKFEVWTPEGRQRFMEEADKDPAQMMADAAMMLMLKGKAAGTAGWGLYMGGKSLGNKGMARGGLKLQRIDRALNEGFHVPFTDKRKGRTSFGLSEVIDPEEWGSRAVSGLPQRAMSRVLSPHADHFDESFRDRLVRAGFDPAMSPATLMSRSQRVALLTSQLESEDDPLVVGQLDKAVESFNGQIDLILEQAHQSGDVASAGQAIGQAFDKFEAQVRADAKKGYDVETPERKSFVMSLRNTYNALFGDKGIKEDSEGLQVSTGFSELDKNPILKGFMDTMERIRSTGEAGLSPEFVEGVGSGEDVQLQGGERRESGIDLQAVQSANRFGARTRLALSPNLNSYAMTYESVPMERVVASHTIDGEPNPLFAELAEFLGAGTLQTREFNERTVRKIASEMRPEALLLDLAATDRGAPIAIPVDYEGEVYYLVLAGNNRIQGLELARREYPASWTLYQEEHSRITPDYGIDPVESVTDVSPVLIRILEDDVNLERFAADSNADSVRRHTTGEQAVKDALTLDDEILSRFNFRFEGSMADILQSAENNDALRLWLAEMEDESGDMYVETTDPADGSSRTELTERGMERLSNAVFRRVFSSPDGLKMLELFETVQSSGIKNIEKAVDGAFAQIAELEAGIKAGRYGEEYSIADDLAKSVVALWEITRQGAQNNQGMQESIGRYLAQQDVPGVAALVEGVSRDLLEILEPSVREPNVLDLFARAYMSGVTGQVTGMFAESMESRESLIYSAKDMTIGDGVLSEIARRVAMEHMTEGREAFEQILADGELRGSNDEMWYRGEFVFFSMGPYYRKYSRLQENYDESNEYGLIFSTNDLQEHGLSMVPEDLIQDSTVQEAAMRFAPPALRAELQQVIKTNNMTPKVRRYILALAQSNFKAPEQGKKHSNEFKVESPLRFTDVAPVGAILAGKPMMITEGTRGSDASKWEYREPTEAELADPEAVGTLVGEGGGPPGIISKDKPDRLATVRESMQREGLSVDEAVEILISGDVEPPREFARTARNTLLTPLREMFGDNTGALHRVLRAVLDPQGDMMEAARNWTLKDRREFIAGLVDVSEIPHEWMSFVHQFYANDEVSAQIMFDADTPADAIKKYESWVDDNFITDPKELEQKALEVRVKLDQKVALNVVDQEVSGYQEIAALAQALRHPGQEYSTMLYLQESENGWVIRDHHITTLGSPVSTMTPNLRSIENKRSNIGADIRIVMIHNHPSGHAEFSNADKEVQKVFQDVFGEKYLGEIVVNSGTYALHWLKDDGSGQYGTVEEVILSAEELGWDPRWETTRQGTELGTMEQKHPWDMGEVSQTHISPFDPLYGGSESTDIMQAWRQSNMSSLERISSSQLIKRLVSFGKSFQVEKNAMVFGFASAHDRLNALVQVMDFHKVQKSERAIMLRDLALRHGGAQVHVFVGDGDWYNSRGEVTRFFEEINADRLGGGVMSIKIGDYKTAWVNKEQDFYNRTWKPEFSTAETVQSREKPPEVTRFLQSHPDFDNEADWMQDARAKLSEILAMPDLPPEPRERRTDPEEDRADTLAEQVIGKIADEPTVMRSDRIMSVEIEGFVPADSQGWYKELMAIDGVDIGDDPSLEWNEDLDLDTEVENILFAMDRSRLEEIAEDYSIDDLNDLSQMSDDSLVDEIADTLQDNMDQRQFLNRYGMGVPSAGGPDIRVSRVLHGMTRGQLQGILEYDFGYSDVSLPDDVLRMEAEVSINADFEYQTDFLNTHGASDSDMKGLEITISMQNIRDMQTKLQKVLDIMESHGADVNDSAGFHVHVDQEGLTDKQLQNIAFAWYKYEWAITQMPGWENDYSPPARGQTGYADTQQYQRAEEEYRKGLEDSKLSQARAGARYKLVRRSRHDTFEFRQGEGTLDFDQSFKNARFALGFVEKFKDMEIEASARPDLELMEDMVGLVSRDAERPSPTRSEQDYTRQYQPYTYGDAEKLSTALRRKIEALKRSPSSNPSELRWYTQLRSALESDMDDSLRAHRPELADKIDQVDLAYATAMQKMNSKYAKHIMDNLGSGLVEGTDNYRKLVTSLFTPDMDVESVGLVYELIGGFDSDAGKRVRRVFLENMFSEAVPSIARTERAKRKQGGGVLKSWRMISPGGMSSALGKWQKKSGQYPSALLEAILGQATVEKLYDLDSLSLQFERVVSQLGGSQTAQKVSAWSKSDYRQQRLQELLSHFGNIFGIGAVAGGSAALGGAGLMALGIGVVAFLTAWLGTAAVGVMMNYMRDKPMGQRYLLEGTAVAMEHVLTGDPIFASPAEHATHKRKYARGEGIKRSNIRMFRRLGRSEEDEE